MKRLIDADALAREMYHKSFEVDDGRNVWNSGLWIRYKIFEEAIRDAPTIDAEPVKHGKWMLYYDIEQGRALRCSECKMVFWVGDGREGNFCPNCGAKMDEEKSE